MCPSFVSQKLCMWMSSLYLSVHMAAFIILGGVMFGCEIFHQTKLPLMMQLRKPSRKDLRLIIIIRNNNFFFPLFTEIAVQLPQQSNHCILIYDET